MRVTVCNNHYQGDVYIEYRVDVYFTDMEAMKMSLDEQHQIQMLMTSNKKSDILLGLSMMAWKEEQLEPHPVVGYIQSDGSIEVQGEVIDE